ncbi:MAG: radical SAM protein [Acidobacteria bacterium]|nr:radical SAM protein [Acidobacteriota bacterium]
MTFQASPDILLLDVNPAFPPVPPLGLDVLATVLEEAGFQSQVLSASPFLPDYTLQLDRLRSFRPRAIGLQIRNYDSALLRQEYPTIASFYRGVALRLRSTFEGVPLILGGIGFSIDPAFWMAQMGANFGVTGSGEVPLLRLLLSLLRNEGSLGEIPSLIAPGRPIPMEHYVPPKLSRTARRHLDIARWRSYAAGAETPLPWANIEIQRGCPFRCDFCVEPRIHGRKVVFKDVRDVLAEIADFVTKDVFDFFFCNSEFNLNLKYCVELCQAIADSSLGERIRWHTYLIPNRLPPELARGMAAAGCRSISLNAVHVDDGILRAFRCPHRRAEYEACLDHAEAAGLEVSNTFLLGSAVETDETIQSLMAFIERRQLRSNLSLGIAHYPGLPDGPAFERTSDTRVFDFAGNGTIPYTLRLSDHQLREIISWTAERDNVVIQNAPLDLVFDHIAPDRQPGKQGYLHWIRQAAVLENETADQAVEKLRHAIPLLDLPEVQLGHEVAVPAPPEPSFLLYGPYRELSVFYQDLAKFLRDPFAQADAIARLMLRFTRCVGEFPRLLSAAAPHISPESSEWLMDFWREQQSFQQLVFASSYACQSKCPYCYAKDIDAEHPGELTMENFALALDWARRQRCEVISFVGGEPTLHPRMREFLELVHKHGLRTYFNSNLLCEPEVIALMDPSWVLNIGIHAQAYRYTRPDRRTHFERNVAFLKDRGVFLFLRYNFERRDEEAICDMLRLAHQLRVPQVNFAIPMPSLSRRNRHAGENELLASGQFLVRVADVLRSEGIRPVLTKPIPPCAIPESRIADLRAGEALSPACNIPMRNWTQNVLVAPDLTISPCVGVSSRGPSLLSFGDFEEISHYMISHLREILRPTPFPQCHTCNFYLDHRCLGGCLAYFTDGQAPTPTRASTQLVELRV